MNDIFFKKKQTNENFIDFEPVNARRGKVAAISYDRGNVSASTGDVSDDVDCVGRFDADDVGGAFRVDEPLDGVVVVVVLRGETCDRGDDATSSIIDKKMREKLFCFTSM